jgi:hypothetical protein
MGESKEKIKKVAMGIVSLVFLIMAYFTFFSDKTPDNTLPIHTVQRAVEPQPVIQAEPQAVGIAPKPALVTAPPLEPAMNIVFQPQIRDIFQVLDSPVQIPSPRPVLPEADPEPAMSAQDLEALKNDLKFKGSILYGAGAVAVINNTFFHIGDTINGHRIVFISEKEVWIDTPLETLKIEILNHE